MDQNYKVAFLYSLCVTEKQLITQNSLTRYTRNHSFKKYHPEVSECSQNHSSREKLFHGGWPEDPRIWSWKLDTNKIHSLTNLHGIGRRGE